MTTAEMPITRRRILAGSAFGLAGINLAEAQGVDAKTIIAARAIHQEEDFKASPQRIYEALLDDKQFTALAGMAAEIHREVGGTFTVFDGHIVGRNLELVPNRRIVQAWRVVPWPEGIYSIARFELVEQGTGTRIVFDHTGFPPKMAESLAAGWNDHYWAGLRKYLV
jgi:activator of HSP90 ATPase